MNRYDIALGKKPPPPKPYLIEITDETRPIYQKIFNSVKDLYDLSPLVDQTVDALSEIELAPIRTISREYHRDIDTVRGLGYGDGILELAPRHARILRRIGMNSSISFMGLRHDIAIEERVREEMRRRLIDRGAVPESIEFREEIDDLRLYKNISAEGHYYET